MYDPSRFGRIVDVEGKPDLSAYMLMYLTLEQCGWLPRFVTVDLTGNPEVDYIIIAIYATQAAVGSVSLSDNASRGKRGKAAIGYWPHAIPPFGARKFDLRLDKVVERGDAAAAKGEGGIVLIPHETQTPLWHSMARELIGGASYEEGGRKIYEEKGVEGFHEGTFEHSTVKKILSNVALIGKVRYREINDDGERYWTTVDAKWPPLVDVELFEAVQREIARRDASPRNRNRKKRGSFPLNPICALCGMPYDGSRLAKVHGRPRTYVHRLPKKRQQPEEYARSVEHGCKQWVVAAAELENALVEAVMNVRGTNDYESQVRDLILARDSHRKAAAAAVLRAAKVVEEIENELAARVKTISVAAGDNKKLKERLDKDVEPLKRNLAAAEAELERCRKFAESKEETWTAVSKILSESRNLASLWSSLEDEDPRRKTLFDYWLLDLLIVVQPVPGKKRLNVKSALARLASIPGSPRHVQLGSSGSSARRTSSRTKASSSAAKLSMSAAEASGEPTLPSAHATCALTSGSGSFSPCVSTGTADGSPQLPSATATFRAKPSRRARRKAEPRENASHASSDSTVRNRSTNEGDSVPGCHADGATDSTPAGACPGSRAAKAGSDDGFENLMLNGHTSCLFCPRQCGEVRLGSARFQSPPLCRSATTVWTTPATGAIRRLDAAIRPARRICYMPC
jgi:hypothetical protein